MLGLHRFPPITQELQQAASASAASETALQQCRSAAADALTSAAQLAARVELAAAASDRRAGVIEENLEHQKKDLVLLAEHVGICLEAAAREDAAATSAAVGAGAAPISRVSYLSSLLGPPGGPGVGSGAYGKGGGGGPGSVSGSFAAGYGGAGAVGGGGGGGSMGGSASRPQTAWVS